MYPESVSLGRLTNEILDIHYSSSFNKSIHVKLPIILVLFSSADANFEKLLFFQACQSLARTDFLPLIGIYFAIVAMGWIIEIA